MRDTSKFGAKIGCLIYIACIYTFFTFSHCAKSNKKARRGKPIDLLAGYDVFFLKLVVPPQTGGKMNVIYRTGAQSCSPKRRLWILVLYSGFSN
jgi:hypothetical protein